ncbi:MAG: hypothetical protein KJ941_08975 [Bacteroidetes bacterium]|nr:hypothetical protein [Bacteroidota bacterium]
MKKLLTTFIIAVWCDYYFSQTCETGALFVSGPGCGCIAGCDLTSYGGPNCGSGTLGNCTNGQSEMSYNFNVPNGCTVNITASMNNRPNCHASGADEGDQLRVRLSTDLAKPYQTSGDNSAMSDREVNVAGPCTVIIEGTSNRSDEIISYQIDYVSGNCPTCVLLPIELIDFNIDEERSAVYWITATEINSSHFILECSTNGFDFEYIATIQAAQKSLKTKYYSADIERFTIGQNYYRLKAYDLDGSLSSEHLISYQTNGCRYLTMDLIQIKDRNLTFNNCGEWEEVQLYNQLGQTIDLSRTLTQGVYFLIARRQQMVQTMKINVP